MVQAAQLRIGNFIAFGKQCCKVYEIQENCFYVIGEKERSFKSTSFELEPITLTEELLFRFGYDLISENHYGILGHLIWKIEGRFYCDKNGIELKYAHRLQNLYFELNNKELNYENTTI